MKEQHCCFTGGMERERERERGGEGGGRGGEGEEGGKGRKRGGRGKRYLRISTTHNHLFSPFTSFYLLLN